MKSEVEFLLDQRRYYPDVNKMCRKFDFDPNNDVLGLDLDKWCAYGYVIRESVESNDYKLVYKGKGPLIHFKTETERAATTELCRNKLSLDFYRI